MIYRFNTYTGNKYKAFVVLEEYWEQCEALYDTVLFLDVIETGYPYRRKPLKEIWKPIKVEFYPKDMRGVFRKRKLADISYVHEARSPVFSEKAREVFGEFLEENGEFLPIYCIDDKKTYYMYNVLTYIDILNGKEYTEEEGVKGYDEAKDPDFDKRSIFKLIPKYAGCYDGSIYVAQKFIDKVEKYKLTGFNPFEEAFPG